jgi:hypothetical protein
VVDKVNGWLIITGVAVMALFGIIIFFKPMMTLMFGVGNSSQAESFPYLHDMLLFSPLLLLVAFIGILIYRWYQRGKNQ